MAAKVFVLRKPAKCADCGKKLPAGAQVRGYPLPSGGWKIYCLKHPKDGLEAGNPPPSDPPPAGSPKLAGSPKPEGIAPAGSWDEVLKRLKQVEAKLDRLLALIEKKDENTSPRQRREGDAQ